MKAFGIMVLGVAAALCPRSARSQLPLQEGMRLRIRPSVGAPVVGTLVERQGDTVVVMPQDSASGRWRVALPDIALLEVSRGVHGHALESAGIGALAGAAMLGVVALADCRDDAFFNSGTCFTVGAVVGAVAGSLVGLVVGAETRTERWEALSPPRVVVGVAPVAGGFAVGLAARF